MEKINGEIISAGIVEGNMSASYKVADIDKLIEDRNREISSDNITKELDIYQSATEHIRQHYVTLYKKMISNNIKNDEENIADIFESLSLLVVDEELTEGIVGAIKEELYTAEYAVYKVSRMFISSLELVEDDYIRQRSNDIEEVANKLISQIIAMKDMVSNHFDNNEENIVKDINFSLNNDLSHILVVDKLLPEMLINNKCNISGIVTKECGVNSHGAIIARTLGIPVLCADIDLDVINGDYGILDCENGKLIIAPTEEIKGIYYERIRTLEENKNQLKKYKDTKIMLENGKEIAIWANVSSIKDIKAAIENGAEGIGLFRTEVLYMDREVAPAEEEQFLVYKEAANLMGDKPVVIRTFDGGLDKPLKFMEAKDADLRGIQLSLKYEHIFKTQLRAIYRAAVYGNIKVMFPMISCAAQIVRINEILAEVKTELTEDNLSYKDIEVGIMIETPSAVELSDILTRDIDFVSIGTNDLIQYTFNRDRVRGYDNEITDEEYEIILRMIKTAVDNAHKNKCKVSVCGELAGDLRFTNKFIEVDVDELSVVPSKILLLRKEIIG